MANRKMHMIVGAVAGGASACFFARDQEPAHQLVETLGGGLRVPPRLGCDHPDGIATACVREESTWPSIRKSLDNG
jgi:hypothetical protein